MAAIIPDHKKRDTFRSYVAPPPGDIAAMDLDNEWCLPSDMRDVHLAKPHLLAKELIVQSAPAFLYSPIAPVNVIEMDIRSTTVSANKEAVFGLLTVTNFKLAFVPLQKNQNQEGALSLSATQETYQENYFLQRNEVTLNNIDHIYQISEAGRVGNKRKKRLEAQQKVMSGRIAALHVVCKNFRLLKFGFQQRSVKDGSVCDYGKLIASALARFAFTSRPDLSFAYRYSEPYYSTLSKSVVTMYSTKNDWARELIRCGATEWQVISSENVPQLRNKLEDSKYSLPSNFVIPKSCTVERFLDLSRAFCDSRAAFWVYGYNKASLVRLAELKPAAQQDTKLENIMLELVRVCDPHRKLKLMQLTDRLPSIQDVQRAYQKFRRLCTPESPQQFLVHDSKFLTLLEKSNWLFYVSLCIRYACETAETLCEGTTCVLQETAGRDLCCIISSLTQLILDPLFRTIDGFQSLIQKEWIALEHPFQSRLGHIRKNAEDSEENESPIFLLFLDCAWQLLQQYPDEFEYSETYLTTLWDSCFIPIFDTFQFNSEVERQNAVRENNLVLRPIWDWGEQFPEKDKVFFSNSLYQRQKQDQLSRRSIAIPPGAVMLPGLVKISNHLQQSNQQPNHYLTQQQSGQRFTLNPQLFVTQSTIPRDRYLQPQHQMCNLGIWEQCYYRWMPVLEIQNGGNPQIDLQHRILLSNIAKLQRALEMQDFDDLPDVYYERTGEQRLPNCHDKEIENERSNVKNTIQNGIENHTETQCSRNNNVELIDGVERRRKNLAQGVNNSAVAANLLYNCTQLPTISSFFPFSMNANENQQLQLIDILTNSNELLEGGSFMERLSLV